MRRWSLLLALLAGCETPADKPPAPTAWVVPPLPAAWTGVPHASIGRGSAPQIVAFGGIAGSAAPLTAPAVWQVPGDGPARAVLGGTLAGKPAVELVEIDTGRVVWRDTANCIGRVTGVSQSAAVCSDGQFIVAIGMDGKLRWRKEATLAGVTDERITMVSGDDVSILASADGRELARVKPPASVKPDEVRASCDDAGRELFASTRGGQLVRIVEGRGAWSVELPHVADLDACNGAQITARLEDDTLVILARDSGKEVSREKRRRVFARRGSLRLEREGSLAALLLDDKGVRAYIPFSYTSAALGDTSLVAARWFGSSEHHARRIVYPPRETRSLQLLGVSPYIAVPAELRDLPPVVSATAAPIATTLDRVTPFTALDGATLYALTVGTDDTAPNGIAAFDARTKAWSWQRDDACGVGGAVGFAVANDRFFCALSREGKGILRAVSREKTLWEWAEDNVDSVLAAGNLVLVIDADRLHLLDATKGERLGVFASDAGYFMPGALLDLAGTELLVTAERNRVVGRLARAQLTPAWSVDVHGSVLFIERAGDGVLVVLADGDAYWIDGRTGVPRSLAAIGARWTVSGDLLLAVGEGGPVPAEGWPPPPPADPKKPAPKGKGKAKAAAPKDDDVPRPPRLMTPIPPPPELLRSWQQVVFSSSGELRSRNDYAFGDPTPADERAPGAPLLLLEGDTVLVLEPDGTPLRRVQIPGEVEPDAIFSTLVDGKPVTGALLANPLRVVLF